MHARIEKEIDGFSTTSCGKKYFGSQVPIVIQYLRDDGILGDSCPSGDINDNYG